MGCQSWSSGFDEIGVCRYSGVMKLSRACAPLCAAALFSVSCSFDYSDAADKEPPQPEIVLDGAVASRFSSARLSIAFSAERLELYDADSVWAGRDVSFTQYSEDGAGSVEAEGNAGLMLVDNANEVYSLGDSVVFRVTSEGLSFDAPDLRWEKKTNWLYAPKDGLVMISRSDGTAVQGTGFVADTLGWRYEMNESAEGSMQAAER